MPEMTDILGHSMWSMIWPQDSPARHYCLAIVNKLSKAKLGRKLIYFKQHHCQRILPITYVINLKLLLQVIKLHIVHLMCNFQWLPVKSVLCPLIDDSIQDLDHCTFHFFRYPTHNTEYLH